MGRTPVQKLGCHGGGEFNLVGDIILRSNIPKGGNLLRGAISSVTVQRELCMHTHTITVMYSIASVLCLCKHAYVFHIHAKF